MRFSEHDDCPFPHDDRKGHHYYIRLSRPVKPPCIVVMTLAVIMLRKKRNYNSLVLRMQSLHRTYILRLLRIVRVYVYSSDFAAMRQQYGPYSLLIHQTEKMPCHAGYMPY